RSPWPSSGAPVASAPQPSARSSPTSSPMAASVARRPATSPPGGSVSRPAFPAPLYSVWERETGNPSESVSATPSISVLTLTWRCSGRGPFAPAGGAASIQQEQGQENRHPQDHAQDGDGSQRSEELSGAQRRCDRGEGGGNHYSLLVDLLGHASRLDRASTVRRSRPRPAWPSGDFLRLGVRDGLHTAHPSAVVSTSATVAPRRPLPVLIRPAERDRANPPMTAPISPTTAATMAPIRPGLMV